jgi:hypothetical protein
MKPDERGRGHERGRREARRFDDCPAPPALICVDMKLERLMQRVTLRVGHICQQLTRRGTPVSPRNSHHPLTVAAVSDVGLFRRSPPSSFFGDQAVQWQAVSRLERVPSGTSLVLPFKQLPQCLFHIHVRHSFTRIRAGRPPPPSVRPRAVARANISSRGLASDASSLPTIDRRILGNLIEQGPRGLPARSVIRTIPAPETHPTRIRRIQVRSSQASHKTADTSERLGIDPPNSSCSRTCSSLDGLADPGLARSPTERIRANTVRFSYVSQALSRRSLKTRFRGHPFAPPLGGCDRRRLEERCAPPNLRATPMLGSVPPAFKVCSVLVHLLLVQRRGQAPGAEGEHVCRNVGGD